MKMRIIFCLRLEEITKDLPCKAVIELLVYSLFSYTISCGQSKQYLMVHVHIHRKKIYHIQKLAKNAD